LSQEQALENVGRRMYRVFVGAVGTRSRIPMDVLLRAYVGELIRSVVKQMTLRKEKGTPLLFYEMKSLMF